MTIRTRADPEDGGVPPRFGGETCALSIIEGGEGDRVSEDCDDVVQSKTTCGGGKENDTAQSFISS